MINQPNRIFGLDVLRAMAIIFVIGSHCTYLLTDISSNIITIIRVLGAVGVDLFFVLSGYLIGGILLKHIKNKEIQFKYLIHFWKRRWLRTLPNYFIILLLNLIVFYCINGYVLPETPYYFVFFQNLVTPHPDFFTEAWSLSVEEYAYILLPILLFFVWYIFKKRDARKLFIWTTLGMILGLYLLKIIYTFTSEISDYKEWSTGFRKLVIYRVDSIYLGFVLVYLIKSLEEPIFKYRRMLFFIGIALFILLHVFIFTGNILPQNNIMFYGCVYLQTVCISLALLFPFFIKMKEPKLGGWIIHYISTRSYAIYLVNFSLILLNIQVYLNDFILKISLYLITTLVVSELLYKTVELPFLKLRERNVPRH